MPPVVEGRSCDDRESRGPGSGIAALEEVAWFAQEAVPTRSIAVLLSVSLHTN